ncbi:hypothetical protein [Streptomyces griseorubiginosus]|uniref:hypothetical protein n=1 Tax=Streptomyces griseorubiginosus TaxID=67304 RepID=UPI0036E57332
MRILVELKPVFIEKVARRTAPVGAIEELIWNGLDADATVKVISVKGASRGRVSARQS